MKFSRDFPLSQQLCAPNSGYDGWYALIGCIDSLLLALGFGFSLKKTILQDILTTLVTIANNIGRSIVREVLLLNIYRSLYIYTNHSTGLPHSIHRLAYHNPRLGLRSGCRCGQTTDQKFFSDIWLPLPMHKYKAFANHYKIHTGRDTHNRTYFSCSIDRRRFKLRGHFHS